MDIINNTYFKGILLTSFVLNSRSNFNTVMGYLRTCKCLVFFSRHVNIKNLFQSQIQIGFNALCILPAVSRETQRQLNLSRDSIINEMNQYDKDIVKLLDSRVNISIMPTNGIESRHIIDTVNRLKKWEDELINKSRVSGAIYSKDNKEMQDLVSQVSHIFTKTNPLHPDVFPTLRKIETWLIKYTLRLYNARNDAKASITSGGTESIFLACKAYRDYFKKPFPEIIVPATAHPAFDKACDCLGIKLIKVPIDYNTSGDDSKLDLSFYKSSINENTILLVGSAPSFPHGEIDPMRDICNLGISYKLPVHMDACLGGFILPFLNEYAGLSDRYDFTMRGITSISCDYHKYALSEKGISILMYNSPEHIKSQYFVYSDWCGGIYATNTLLGSRPGSIIAVTWAGILARGYEYYRDNSTKILRATRTIATELSSIPGVSVFGDPKKLTNVVAFTTTDFDIYSVNSELRERGWNLNPLQFPSSLHLCVTEANCSTENVKAFISDTLEAVDKCRQEYSDVKPEDGGSIYGTSQKISNRALVGSVAKIYLDSLYFSN
jgi:sphinganine-1-phosphate aldolase